MCTGLGIVYARQEPEHWQAARDTAAAMRLLTNHSLPGGISPILNAAFDDLESLSELFATADPPITAPRDDS
jgi:hypothetical protein